MLNNEQYILFLSEKNLIRTIMDAMGTLIVQEPLKTLEEIMCIYLSFCLSVCLTNKFFAFSMFLKSGSLRACSTRLPRPTAQLLVSPLVWFSFCSSSPSWSRWSSLVRRWCHAVQLSSTNPASRKYLTLHTMSFSPCETKSSLLTSLSWMKSLRAFRSCVVPLRHLAASMSTTAVALAVSNKTAARSAPWSSHITMTSPKHSPWRPSTTAVWGATRRAATATNRLTSVPSKLSRTGWWRKSRVRSTEGAGPWVGMLEGLWAGLWVELQEASEVDAAASASVTMAVSVATTLLASRIRVSALFPWTFERLKRGRGGGGGVKRKKERKKQKFITDSFIVLYFLCVE